MTSPAARLDTGKDLPGRAAAAQRRVLAVLVAAQVLSGAGLAAGITVGALLAQEMLDSTRLSGVPSGLFTAGSAVAAVLVGRVSQRHGRRPGLAAGYAAGAVGSAGVIAAAVADSAPLLFLSLFVYGAGSATNLQARYAGADLADSRHRGRAVSTVLVATTLGGVVGPNLAAPTGAVAQALGMPRLAGPFLLAGAAYAAGALFLAVWLRPDPLLLAREIAASPKDPEGPAEGAADPPDTAAPPRHGLPLGAGIMGLAQLVMVAIMTMTPVHMHAHGHTTAASGLVISLHVAAMFLPSPLTGWLVDRVGRLWTACASGVVLLAAGLLAASAPPASLPLLAVALVLLGLGWNLGLISGTALITDSAALATRARTQGMVDVAIAVSGAVGGMASGFVVADAGYPVLAAVGGALALTLLPAVALAGRARSAPHGRA
ncbi:MFS transporter [Streptomyces sp. CC77]|uniref:MFS transporter n=1 Tax=Streptomyces sp. CC77 TaxID=1906739 RepID=UPI0009A0F1DC|nr:MFS transporter [Streptomyces sp. CC77]